MFDDGDAACQAKGLVLTWHLAPVDMRRQGHDLGVEPGDCYGLLFSAASSASACSLFGALLNGAALSCYDAKQRGRADGDVALRAPVKSGGQMRARGLPEQGAPFRFKPLEKRRPDQDFHRIMHDSMGHYRRRKLQIEWRDTGNNSGGDRARTGCGIPFQTATSKAVHETDATVS